MMKLSRRQVVLGLAAVPLAASLPAVSEPASYTFSGVSIGSASAERHIIGVTVFTIINGRLYEIPMERDGGGWSGKLPATGTVERITTYSL